MPTLALILALISSPRIGVFMDIPDWMPSAIPADSTPGNSSNDIRRVTADVYAGMIAAQEAYWERTYYMLETSMLSNGVYRGQSLIAPEDMAPYTYGAWAGFGTIEGSYTYNLPTNRFVSRSRRITLPEGYEAMRKALPGRGRRGVPAICFGDTPSFSAMYNADRTETFYNLTRFPKLSSSLLPDTMPAFPTFAWTSDPISAIGEWRRGLKVNGSTGGTMLVGESYDNNVPAIFNIFNDAIYNHAQGDHGWLIPGYGPSDNPVADLRANMTNATPFNIETILSDTFAAVDFAWLTNETRRLVWNRLAAYNEVIAALNRTYFSDPPRCWDNYQWPVATQYVYQVSVDAEAECTISGMRLSSDGTITGYDPHPSMNWSQLQPVFHESRQDVAGPGCAYRDVTAPAVTVAGGAYPESLARLGINLASFSGMTFTPSEGDRVHFTLSTYGTVIQGGGAYLHATLAMAGNNPPVNIYEPIPIPSSVTVPLTMTGFGEYNFTTTIVTPPYPERFLPGRQAMGDGVVKECEIASVAWMRATSTNTLFRMRCNRDISSSAQSLDSFAASDVSGLNSYLDSVVSELCGADASNPSAYLLPLVQDALMDAGSGGPTVSAGLIFTRSEILDDIADMYLTLDQGAPQSLTVELNDGTILGSLTIGGSSLVITVAPGSYTPATRPACTVEANSSQCYRIDWQWNALNLSTAD